MMILDTAHTVRSGCTGADNVVVWSAAFDARVVDQDVQCAQVLAHGIDMSPISSAASAELGQLTRANSEDIRIMHRRGRHMNDRFSTGPYGSRRLLPLTGLCGVRRSQDVRPVHARALGPGRPSPAPCPTGSLTLLRRRSKPEWMQPY